MNLIIFYNEKHDEQSSLYDTENGRLILKGDYYHDQIQGKIEGYLKALNDYSIYVNEVPVEYINKDHELFDKIGFYCE